MSLSISSSFCSSVNAACSSRARAATAAQRRRYSRASSGDKLSVTSALYHAPPPRPTRPSAVSIPRQQTNNRRRRSSTRKPVPGSHNWRIRLQIAKFHWLAVLSGALKKAKRSPYLGACHSGVVSIRGRYRAEPTRRSTKDPLLAVGRVAENTHGLAGRRNANEQRCCLSFNYDVRRLFVAIRQAECA